MTLMVDVPPTLDAARREHLAVVLYDARLITQGQAAELAELSRAAFLDALGRYGVTPFQYDAQEVLAELAFLEQKNFPKDVALVKD